MVYSVGFLVGESDLASFKLIAVLAILMGFCGYGMDLMPSRQAKRKLPAQWPYDWLALLAALAPLASIGIYIAATHVFGDGHVLSAYVYSLLATLVVFVCLFGANHKLMEFKKWAWRNNAYGELWYMLLSLAVTTAVSWQIFAAALRP